MAAYAARGPVQAGLSGSSETRGIAGLERMAQTDVRQNAADYNRRPAKWKDFLSVEVRQALQYQQVIADEADDFFIFDDRRVADTKIVE